METGRSVLWGLIKSAYSQFMSNQLNLVKMIYVFIYSFTDLAPNPCLEEWKFVVSFWCIISYSHK